MQSPSFCFASRQLASALLALLREMDVIEGTHPDGQPIYAEHILTRDPHERVSI